MRAGSLSASERTAGEAETSGSGPEWLAKAAASHARPGVSAAGAGSSVERVAGPRTTRTAKLARSQRNIARPLYSAASQPDKLARP
jgi:hypothetical protein